MSHSYTSNRIHVIFSTKNREKRISEELQTRLWPYMAGIAANHGFEAMKVGGVEDHAHALLLLPPTLPLAKAVQIFKSCSSKWINDTKAAGRDFAWQEGYGAFSVSASQTEGVIKYIAGHAAHHAKRSYEDEFIDFLKKCGVEYDPKHVLG
jgi:REP element-mobilizing transposase RayT